jgi:hypothetical protein
MTTALRDATDAELEAELARRKAAANPGPVAKPFEQCDWSSLYKMLSTCAEADDDDNYPIEDDDFAHYVYEAAIQIVFGPKLWEWKSGR